MIVPLLLGLGVVLTALTLHLFFWNRPIRARDYGFPWWIVAAFAAFLAFMIGGLVWNDHREASDCANRGGKIVGTGRYNPPTYVASGNVLIPIAGSEITECQVP